MHNSSKEKIIPYWKHVYSGKVRDIYVPEKNDYEVMLMLASNRISASDMILNPEIPKKGEIITKLSNWWLKKLSKIENQLITDPNIIDSLPPIPESIANRSVLVKKLDMIPIECVVRQYLTGSAWVEYQETGSICGVTLQPGLKEKDRLPQAIFTPAYKAPLGEHDENITFTKCEEIVGENIAKQIKHLSLDIFQQASEYLSHKGLLLVDTKFEFGVDKKTNRICLADEVLTSDSSRYWLRADYEKDRTKVNRFDKQIVREWLKKNWKKSDVLPSLPDELISQTITAYEDLYERITG